MHCLTCGHLVMDHGSPCAAEHGASDALPSDAGQPSTGAECMPRLAPSVAYQDHDTQIIHGDVVDALKLLPDRYAQTVVTSPPYWGLRDYGVSGQIGLERTPQEYVDKIVSVFREVRRVLKDDGTLWLNLGDAYAAHLGQRKVTDKAGSKQYTNAGSVCAPSRYVEDLKPKDLVGIPWRVAFALQADGWYLRSDIIWAKPNPMPESVTDRPTKAHEYLFLLSKSERYFYDSGAIKEPSEMNEASRKRAEYGGYDAGQAKHRDKGKGIGKVDYIAGKTERYWPTHRNRRTVWTVATQPFPDAHFATFPPKLIEPCILAGSRPSDVVLDCFHGAGTTGLVAQKFGRKYVGIELNKKYIDMSLKRIQHQPLALPLDLAPLHSVAECTEEDCLDCWEFWRDEMADAAYRESIGD